MQCPLKVFCDFLEAPTLEKRKALVRRYKKGTTERSKGMIVYYSPALRIMRGRLCPEGSLEEKLAALREHCVIAKWTDKLNEARLEANVLVLKAFHAHFGNKRLKIFPSPKLACLLSASVAITIQPELYATVDGVPMVWKLHVNKNPPREKTIRLILQMLHRALKSKGLAVPIRQICFFDLRSGSMYVENVADESLEKTLRPVAKALAEAWETAA
jgi:hypothetical protein